jgi:hypothetical protein
MNSAEHHKLSTSALAKTLDIPLQQLFGTLRDCGWIRKVEDGWVLTAKGEFEGGEYIHSKRYGRYIVWPDSILEHQLLRGIESNRLLNSTQLARKYQLSARLVRRALGELGLLQRTFNGWELTRAGEQIGGVSIDSEHGDSDISWPENIIENPLIVAQFDYLQQWHADSEPHEADLLAAITELDALDGHRFHSRNEWTVCNWLYFAGIAHAHRRRLPLAHEHFCDFWLPEAQIYIEVGGDEKDAGAISSAMQRIEIYQQQQWRHIEIRAEHFAALDDYLTRRLHEFGIRVL